MVSYNTDALREFGNLWVNTGNEWSDALNSMNGAMSGLAGAWTGEAGAAAVAVWNNHATSMSTQPQGAAGTVATTVQQAITTAWQIGDAIADYADQIDAAVKEINKAQLESLLAFLFGALLGFLLPELGALLTSLFEVIGEVVGEIVAAIEQFVTSLGALGTVAGFSLNAALGAVVWLGVDLLSQQLASWAVGFGSISVNWVNEIPTLLGGALGGAAFGPEWTGAGDAGHATPEEAPAPHVPSTE
ncbi:MAG: hypothetical protein QOF98_2528, partial [Streptomyces sp.]|nr:hypothetical protein [Streptomyces sp.]